MASDIKYIRTNDASSDKDNNVQGVQQVTTTHRFPALICDEASEAAAAEMENKANNFNGTNTILDNTNMTKKTLNIVSRSFKRKKKWGSIPENCADGNVKFSKHDDVTPNSITAPSPEVTPPQLYYYQLFKYSTLWEKLLVAAAFIFTSVSAFALPFIIIMYGEYSALLIDRTVGIGTSTLTPYIHAFGGGKILTNATFEENMKALIDDSSSFSVGCLIASSISIITCAIGIDLLNYTAINQIGRIRKMFLKSILQQDMAWFDTTTNNNFATKITDDLEKIKDGIGEKLGMFTVLIVSFTTTTIYSLICGWKLALAMLSCAPLIVISTAYVTKIQSSLAEKELKSYSIAGAVAEEVLSGIRTVMAFGGEQKECERYRDRLRPAEKSGKKKGIYTGIGSGLMWFVTYTSYAIAFWYGTKLIIEDRLNLVKEYTPAILIIVLFGIICGAQNLGFTSPLLETFSNARGAGASVFSIIDRKPVINSMDTSGLKPKNVIGNIEFKNIYFRYPSRKDTDILHGLNLTIKSGQTVALVGPSGCGKSTCLQLLQRLYDPEKGCVRIDGIKINELNTCWLRSNIGVVGQEPVLFATTIGENIKYGNPNATQEDIISAAKSANCHDFIVKLPSGYDTMVGERGAHLSGGQKQRVAIARALVRNPKILLLDEATSALDPTSERVVQEALEKAAVGRTTIVVSHRLSTITNSDQIIFIQNGEAKEAGTHSELMKKAGLYYNLVKATHSNAGQSKNSTDEMDVESRKMSDAGFGVKETKDFNVEEDSIEEEKQEDEKVPTTSFWQVMKLNLPEWRIILIGCIGAMFNGSSLPIYSVFFGEFYGILGEAESAEVLRQSNTLSMIFVGFGLCVFLVTFLQIYMFNIASVKLTSRLRQSSFKSILSQEIGWFDDHKNSTGQLCARLSGDCAAVQGAAGTRLGTMVQSFSSLIVGVIMSLCFSWDLALVSLAFVPIVFGSVILESRYMTKSAMLENEAMGRASKIAIEAISNIRTVVSLGQELHVLERFTKEIDKAKVACQKRNRLRGIIYSFGQSSYFLSFAVSFYYGGYKVANGEIHYKSLIIVTETLVFGTWVLAQGLVYAPDVSGALLATGRIMKLLSRQSKMRNSPTPIKTNDAPEAEANIKYEGVHFRYPTRSQIPVMEDLNLDIPKGSTVALVGPSGCGKSTCMQLLLRFYDPDSGHIDLNGTPTIDYPIQQLRSQHGLVSQEPILFDRTIAENIAYGDNAREVPMAEIIEAAKKANIHEFVSNLLTGYETRLGSNGAQLSGGQKQRIAIARALVRNPRVLLLDEATSALDTHSEKVVQQALDAARAGRTCIMIAHRLTTVKNADLICVIQGGVVVEKGTHSELIRLGKIYAELYSMQEIT